MNRRFNYTGRVRITRDHFTIRLHDGSAGSPPSFDADLSGLSALELDANARIVIEAYVRQSNMRFDFGTVASPLPPVDRRLTEIDRGPVVQFRIKVVDTVVKHGRVLAMADQIRAITEDDGDDRRSILPLAQRDLGEAVWKLEVSEDESPVLVLNNRIPEIAVRICEDPVLQGAIFSAAVREILRVILSETANAELEWVRDWREFTEGLNEGEIPDFSDEPEAGDIDRKTFIEQIVERFANRERWSTTAQPVVAGTEVSDE